MEGSELQQKRRNRAIKITDIAISKVPRTKFFGFSSEQNEQIQEYHKELLLEAKKLCNEKKNNEMEVAILVHLHTWEHWIIHGYDSRKVVMRKNPKANQVMQTGRKNSLLLMHNHPSTGTFSGEDFKTFCETDSLYIITVVGNDGSIYVLTKNVNFNKDEALSEYGRLTEKYKDKPNNATLAMREILKNATRYNLSYKFGRKKL